MGHLLPVLTIRTAKYIHKENSDTGLPCPLGCGGTIIKRKTSGENIFMAAATTPSAALLPGMKLSMNPVLNAVPPTC
jgi:hypothetical protein